MKYHERFLLLLIILLAFSLRFYGINWDSGFHLHPDERMIIMVAEKISLKNLNPKFFAYGSFPIYLLKATGSFFKLDNYNQLLYVGRFLSILFDVLTVFLIYQITKISLPRSHLGRLMASFLYAISVLPIQASHFYAVDIILTTLSTFTLYRLLVFLKKPSIKNSLSVGLFFGLSLATKVTIGLLLVPIFITLLLIYLQKKSLKIFFKFLIVIFIFSFLIFTLTMPYAILDFSEFKRQILSQLQMNSNPYTFPFTLQYVGTIPYWYYLKNIILWGLGIPYGIVSLVSLIVFTIITFKGSTFKGERFVLIIFFWLYFVVVGRTAVKFMRYFLPLYPLLAIFTACTISLFYRKILSKINIKRYLFIVHCSLFIVLVWPFSFIQIYAKPNTRVVASSWILQNIPAGKTLGVEHWDDRLPLRDGQKYVINEFPLYEKDTPYKWQALSSKISQTDYIILASNRLYTPLSKLTDCQKHGDFCYPLTASYYRKLFSQELGFKLVGKFTSYPKIPLLNIEIINDQADESFTVYDHPKIMIFKNELYFSNEQILKLITQE